MTNNRSNSSTILSGRQVLLTGATGFVGRYLYPALVAAGCKVRCATRRLEPAMKQFPGREWVELDVERPETIAAAMAGCDAAYYLIHGMEHGGGDYPDREAQSARNFAAAAGTAGLERIVYLGGVLPASGRASKHLASRRRTGELLRGGPVNTIELRAAMIVGVGSASWNMVRDLAARLPAMILPRWLRNHSHPIAIDDVIWALVASMLVLEIERSQVLEIPGPERVSHKDVLSRVAAVMGHRRPMFNVPILSPRLSSYWIALVTRVDLALARELVEGVRHDLDPVEPTLWTRVPHTPMTIEAAAQLALDAERESNIPSALELERIRAIGAQLSKATA